jgi:anti-sigma regulatory factor (Ser/Thr protein kinase)
MGWDAVGEMARRDGSMLEISPFTVGDLHRLREMVAQASRAVGLSRLRTENLILAVNEIATNAIQHAGGGSVVVEHDDAMVAVEVRDHGPGLPVDQPTAPPGADAEGGRGLWLARRLCRGLSVASGPAGVTVRLNMSRVDG